MVDIPADTGWHNDKPTAAVTHPLGLGFTDFRRGPRARASRDGVLKRKYSFQICNTSPEAPQQHAENRFYRLYRSEFEAMSIRDRVRSQRETLCRSQNPRADNTDVGEGRPDILPVKKGDDKGLPKLVGATNGAAVHMNGSANDEEPEAAVKPAWLTWWYSIPRRYIIVGLCFVAFLLCNMDRVCDSLLLLCSWTRHNAYAHMQ